MTRPVCEITGRYLAEQNLHPRALAPRADVNPPPGEGQVSPATNSDWAQLARVVIAQEMALRGGVK